MTLVSKAALAVALALGPVAMLAVPGEALAQKKAKKGEAAAAAASGRPTLKLGKEFRAAAQPIDAAYKVSDWRGVLTAADAAEASATTPDERYQLNEYRLAAADRLKDPAAQAKAVDALLATGLVPAADKGRYQYYAGKFAVDAGNAAKANTALDAAEAAGYVTPDLYLLRARLYSTQKQSPQSLAALEKAISSEKAAGRPVPEDWYKFGYSEASRGKLPNEVARWMTMHLRAFPSAANWRTSLVTYRDSARLPTGAQLDLYRLMRASNSLAGERDHWDYATIADNEGASGEAEIVLKPYMSSSQADLKALYSKVNGRVKAGDRASLVSEEKTATAAANGRLAARVGNALLGYGDYARAATLFQTALTKGGVDADEVNTRLGIALAMQGQKDAARTAFAQVKGPRQGVAQYWVTYLDQGAATAA